MFIVDHATRSILVDTFKPVVGVQMPGLSELEKMDCFEVCAHFCTCYLVVAHVCSNSAFLILDLSCVFFEG